MVKNEYISHYSTTSWGSSVSIMERGGKAFAHMYWYNDDKTIVYLDKLSVDKDARKLGIGTNLQEIREKVAKDMGAITVCLWMIWARENSWIHDWYIRRGYKDWKDHESEENAVWMRKSLTEE